VTKNGIVYLKVRRCPCCRLTNYDENPVAEGPLAASTTVMWHKGTSTNPVGRMCRICFVGFTQGGFVDQFENLEAFLDARKESRPLMEEWTAAYDAVVRMGPDLPVRLGKVYLEKLGETLAVARKQRVEAFKKSQKRAATSYRAVLKSKYEKKHPGKIARKGLTCKFISVDGGKQVEVVLIRKLPKDEWDLTYEDVSGVAHSEEYDAGDISVRKSQAAVKYQGLANKIALTKGDLDGVASEAADSDTTMSNADGNSVGACGSESDSNGDDEDQDALLSTVTACLLDDRCANAKPKEAATSLRPSTQSASTRAPMSSPRSSKAATARSSAPSRSGASAHSSKPESEAGSTDEALRRKFRGKSAEDILGPHGYGELQKDLDEILASMHTPCFDSMLSGGSLGSYIAAVAELKKKAAMLQRGIVNLDIKVKKWKEVPERVGNALSTARTRIKALNDALTAFAGIAKSNDSQRMEVAKAALESADIPVPKAFHVLFFKEQACDFIRFRHLDSFTAHVQMGGAGYIKEGMFSKTDNATDLLVDTAADALKMLVQGCVREGDGVKHAEVIAELADKIIGCQHGLPESAVSDLTLVSQALGDVAAVSDRSSALAELLRMVDNEGPGILMPMLREPSCRVLLTSLQSRYQSSQPCQETLL